MRPPRHREEPEGSDGDDYADELRRAAVGGRRGGAAERSERGDGEDAGVPDDADPGEGLDDEAAGPGTAAVALPLADAGARESDPDDRPRPRRRGRLLPVLTVLCLVLGLGMTGLGALLALQPEAVRPEPSLPPEPMTAEPSPSAPSASPEQTQAAPTASPTPTADGGAPAIAGDVRDPQSVTVMVNKLTPLEPQDYVPADLVPMSAIGVPSANGHALRQAAADAVILMFQAAAAEGYALDMTSGYRSYESQTGLYEGYVAELGQEGADATSARPGYSEHQTGLAADISAPSAGCVLEQCFAQTAEGRWLATNSWRYGFILRYPEGMTGVTGYEFEPWHFRYVGVEVATAMHDGGYATYEQFLGYPPAPGYA